MQCPRPIAQAGRISGVSPADIINVFYLVKMYLEHRVKKKNVLLTWEHLKIKKQN